MSICTAGSDKWVSFHSLLVLDKVLGLIPVARNAFQAQDVIHTTASKAFHNTVVFSKKDGHYKTKISAKSVSPFL